uniref:Capsid protein n=1 Tax=Biomphalaria pfeifferi virus TaxID=2884323 RepID=A0A8K1P6L4_9VIRU|nr:MAG: capsid protein precursor [Biomphalaria pfeifferi virus]
MLDITYSEILQKWKVDNRDCVLVTEQWWKCQPLWFRLAQKFNFDITNWSGWTQYNNENMMIDESQAVLKLVDAPDRVQIDCQSGVEHNKNQVVTFLQTPDKQILELGASTSDSRIKGDPVELGEFLRRPVLINRFQWAYSELFVSFNPWRLLIENPRIANRINNYNLFKAKCHVKFVLNGNGFFYGRLMVTYLPFPSQGEPRAVNPLGGDDLYVGISQAPKVFLDPTNSAGAEMILPFFYPYSYLCLTESSILRDLGSIYINDIVPLKHANQNLAVSGEKVTVSVYAWFEDVELQGPTSRDLTLLEPQSGRECETESKPISQAATAVANVASTVKDIPVLGKYALAVEKAARVTSSVASAIGFCKPVAVEEPERFIPRTVGSMAVINTTSSSQKFSLDIKQETSISPLDVNLPSDDQMSFNYIAQRDSYLNKFTWSSSAASGSFLQGYLVTPYTFRRDTFSLEIPRISMTAVCGVANCFKYWTGSLIYRFQIVKSAFHRGRLVVIYDPKHTRPTKEENINFSNVIDIGETSEFEITVSNYQDREWLRTPTESSWWDYSIFSSNPITLSSISVPTTNGIISFYVENELTTPNSDPTLNTDITIVCYVRAGPDFQVADPQNIGGWQTVNPQSGEEKLFGDSVVSSDDQGEGIRSLEYVNPMPLPENKVYMGEVVSNFRTLLKRDNYYCTIIFQDISIIDWFKHYMYPLFPQVSNDFPISPSKNKCRMTMLSYVRCGFIGFKGSVRWKIAGLFGALSKVVCNRTEIQVPYVSGQIAYTDLSTFCTDFAATCGDQVMRGAALTFSTINPTIDIELPYYNPSKFLLVKTSGSMSYLYHSDAYGFNYSIVKSTIAGAIRNLLTMYVSAGEDFTCYFFVGWLPMYPVNPY